MEQKTKSSSLNTILVAIGSGVWDLVLQNAGIIPKLVSTENVTQTVYVTGGNINADVSGSVSVDNTVDINIHEINGYNQVTTGKGTHSVFPYGYMLPVDSW
ncbi:MAG TPA: hypothetical protein VKZ45_05050 [Vicingaceae bacterium]|nr:hypothetical protein [Vicingaceae bacterium]